MTDVERQTRSRSAELAKAGIRTGEDFADLMSALMSDILEGHISPIVANATVNAGGKLLKIVQMQMQYRYTTQRESKGSVLILAPGARKPEPELAEPEERAS